MARQLSALLIFGFLFILSCTSGADKEKNLSLSTATFEIEGMVCKMGCAAIINEKIAELEGVKNATVSFEEKTARVEFDPARVNADGIKEAVKDAGNQYEIKNLQISDSNSATPDPEAKGKKLKTPAAEKSVAFKPIVFPDIFQNLKKIF